MQQHKCNYGTNNGFGNFSWNDLNKVLDGIFSGTSHIFGRDQQSQTPPANVLEHSDRLEIALAVPGFAKSDFQLGVEGDVLTISAKREPSTVKESVKVQRKEFDYSTFKRSFRLSDKFDYQRISARYENGILTISVPDKIKAEQSSVRIEVL